MTKVTFNLLGRWPLYYEFYLSAILTICAKNDEMAFNLLGLTVLWIYLSAILTFCVKSDESDIGTKSLNSIWTHAAWKSQQEEEHYYMH